jgi:hypothetical protein
VVSKVACKSAPSTSSENRNPPRFLPPQLLGYIHQAIRHILCFAIEELCEKDPEAGEFVLRCKFLHPPPAAETNASKDPPSKKRKMDPKRTGVGGQDAHLPALSGCEHEYVVFPHH